VAHVVIEGRQTDHWECFYLGDVLVLAVIVWVQAAVSENMILLATRTLVKKYVYQVKQKSARHVKELHDFLYVPAT
jgi:hypothetical protein